MCTDCSHRDLCSQSLVIVHLFILWMVPDIVDGIDCLLQADLVAAQTKENLIVHSGTIEVWLCCVFTNNWTKYMRSLYYMYAVVWSQANYKFFLWWNSNWPAKTSCSNNHEFSNITCFTYIIWMALYMIFLVNMEMDISAYMVNTQLQVVLYSCACHASHVTSHLMPYNTGFAL